MAARKHQHVAADRAHPGDDAVGAGAGFVRRFAARAPVAEKLPAGPLAQDLGGADTLVFAVIPFDEVRLGLGFDLRPWTKPGERAGARGTLERACQHPDEAEPAQPLAEPPRLLLAGRGQRQVGEASVLARQAPFGLAMAGERDDRVRHRGVTPS